MPRVARIEGRARLSPAPLWVVLWMRQIIQRRRHKLLHDRLGVIRKGFERVLTVVAAELPLPPRAEALGPLVRGRHLLHCVKAAICRGFERNCSIPFRPKQDLKGRPPLADGAGQLLGLRAWILSSFDAAKDFA